MNFNQDGIPLTLSIIICLIIYFLIGCSDKECIIEKGPLLKGIITNSITGEPIPDVILSDGYNVWKTDKNGEYSFHSHNDAKFIFYSLPSAYNVSLKEGRPDFYDLIDKELKVQEKNFKLTPLPNGTEEEFSLICVADPQVKNESNLRRFNNETIKDINSEKEKYSHIYGVVLGDIVYDNMELFEDIKYQISSTKIPFFYTIGNHDFNYIYKNPLNAQQDYENHFGPTYYSFSRGDAFFIVINNILYKGNKQYDKGFTNDQISWLAEIIKYIGKDKLLIICIHIPIINPSLHINGDKFFQLISNFSNVHIMSGHSHANQNIKYSNTNIYEHVHGAASGLWWSSTINKDGTPNGYSIYTIKDGDIYNWYYKSVNFDSNYQMRLYSPYSYGDSEGYVIANVWNADNDWKIELFENGVKTGDMVNYYDFDPATYSYLSQRAVPFYYENGNPSPWYFKTNHLFRMKPTLFNSTVEVHVTDRFGKVYKERNFFHDIDKLRRY